MAFSYRHEILLILEIRPKFHFVKFKAFGLL